MPGDRLAAQAGAVRSVCELAVAVGGLVQVHEVHVDLRPREIAVELCMQVEQGLLEEAQPL